MKLPDVDLLCRPEHRFLHDHDLQEFHNPNKGDFSCVMYLERFQRVLKAVKRFGKGSRVLDIGCAQGNFALTLAEEGLQVVAFDLQFSFLTYLRLKHEYGDMCCINGTVEHLPFRNGTFGIVLIGELLEHVAYPESLLANAANLLAPGGILVITTPNASRLHTGLPTLSAIRDRRELVARQFQPDADGHLFLLTKRELLRMTREVGLSVKTDQFFCTPWITGRLRFRHVIKFVPVKVRLLLERVTLRLPVINQLLCEGQLLVAQRESY